MGSTASRDMGSEYPYGEITIVEVIPLFLRILRLVGKVVFKSLTYPISSRKFTFKRTIWRTFVQTICPDSTLRQMQWLSPRVGLMYEIYIRKYAKHLEIIHEDVGEGGSLHWLGPKNADKVMLYIHGGGYVTSAIDGHFLMVDHWRKQIKQKHGINMSVAMLEYSLVNHAPWPQQVRQVVASFTHLLNAGIDPSNMIIAGDSVGGHAVVFLLGHLLHPHPAAKPVPQLSSPIAGAVIISPWLTFSESSSSFAAHASTDLMPVPTLRKWAKLLQASREANDDANWFEPEKAEAKWWTGLDQYIDNVLFTAGGAEVMFDDIVSTKKKMSVGAGNALKVDCYVQEGCSHNEALSEFACGDKPGPTNDRIISFIAEVFA